MSFVLYRHTSLASKLPSNLVNYHIRFYLSTLFMKSLGEVRKEGEFFFPFKSGGSGFKFTHLGFKLFLAVGPLK